MLFTATILISFLNSAFAECPNACSAHGKCGAYDMCTCYRNWMSNDCSERICQFGLAHVDVPKGDLDASSGALQMTDHSNSVYDVVVKSDMYPKGTSEQFPSMLDTAQAVLTDTAHEYAECSNKGLCDRVSGICQCFDGYSGSACQRASCPDTGAGVCSGHGTCENIKTIARWDYNNVYKLWDEAATMGCVCDGGYTGADCSERMCKFGADPLYQDSYQTLRYGNWTYSFVTSDATAVVVGNYSLVYTDAVGETWKTDAIDIDATCSDVITAFESLPNNVIPEGTIECVKHLVDTVPSGVRYEPVDTSSYTMHSKYTIAFPSNPGATSLTIDTKLDGSRDTLYTTTESTNTLQSFIYNNGFYGENEDFVPDLCEGVKISFDTRINSRVNGRGVLIDLSATDLKTFKKCLGDNNGDTTDNVGVENWDYGSVSNPHLIKVVDATQESLVSADDDVTHTNYVYKASLSRLCKDGATANADGLCEKADPPGFYVAIFWDNTNEKFVVLGRPETDYASSTEFHVYTTTGRLAIVDSEIAAFNTWEASNGQVTSNLLSNKLFTHKVTGASTTTDSVGCELNSATDCLQKDDYAMVFHNGAQWGSTPASVIAMGRLANPIYPQIYQVKKVSMEPIPFSDFSLSDPATYTYADVSTTPTFVRNQIVFDKVVNAQFNLDIDTDTADTEARVYKFYPPDNAYEFAGECSLRGICNHDTGLCSCFSGFDGDNCQRIDALASR